MARLLPPLAGLENENVTGISRPLKELAKKAAPAGLKAFPMASLSSRRGRTSPAFYGSAHGPGSSGAYACRSRTHQNRRSSS